MKQKLILGILLLACSCRPADEERTYLRFLEKQDLTAKDYVLNQFENHDLVLFCERTHDEFTQYELLRDIVSDPYFIDNVGHIYMEVGSMNMDERINRFLQSDFEDPNAMRDTLTGIFRDIDYSLYWHCYNYPWFLAEIYRINQTLPVGKKLEVHPVDVCFDWNEIRTPEQYAFWDENWSNRDSIMASHTIARFEQVCSSADPRKKGLIIMNYKHAFLKDHRIGGEPTTNAGRWLADRYGNRVASVYLMGLAIPEGWSYTVVQDGKWDYYFETAGKTDVGFDLKCTPFGRADFDAIPPDSLNDFRYEDMFTGLIFYKPIGEHRKITGWQGFTTPDFVPELRKRMEIFSKAMDPEGELEESFIQEHLYKNDTVRESRYDNLEQHRARIDQWKK